MLKKAIAQKKGWIICILLLVGFSFLTVSCKKGHGSSEKRMNYFLGMIQKELSLNSDQKKVLDELKDEMMSHQKKASEAHQKMGEKILTHLENDTFTKENVKEVIKAHDENKEVVMNAFIEGVVEFYNVLDPEQKSKLIERVSDFHKLHSL